jgi:hypothetical protein
MIIVDIVALQRFFSSHCFGIAAVAGVGIEDARVGRHYCRASEGLPAHRVAYHRMSRYHAA